MEISLQFSISILTRVHMWDFPFRIYWFHFKWKSFHNILTTYSCGILPELVFVNLFPWSFSLTLNLNYLKYNKKAKYAFSIAPEFCLSDRSNFTQAVFVRRCSIQHDLHQAGTWGEIRWVPSLVKAAEIGGHPRAALTQGLIPQCPYLVKTQNYISDGPRMPWVLK